MAGTNYYFGTNTRVNAANTTVQDLADGDTLYVATNATLAALGSSSMPGTLAESSAISTGGAGNSARMTINGALYSATADGIFCGDADQFIVVGRAGQINSISSGGAGIRLGVDAAGTATVQNAGVIAGAAAISLYMGDLVLTNTGQLIGFDNCVYSLSSGNVAVNNSGTISGASVGIYSTGVCNVTNSGLIEGTDFGDGVRSYGGGFLTNSGTISGGAGVSMNGYSVVTNTGTISGYYGLSLSHSTSNTSVTNDGTIAAAQTGIYLLGYSGNQHIVNSGTIVVNTDPGAGVPGVGILMTEFDSPNFANLIVTNTGDISVLDPGGFAIQAYYGNDTVTNRGTITGNIELSIGDDTYRGAHGSLEGTAFGGAGNDALTGGSEDDSLDGGDNDDVLIGKAGDDALVGGAGRDTITGGKDDDALSGGGNRDTFVYKPGFGHDTITDFVAGSSASHDIIKFGHDVFADFADVSAHMAQVGADVVITTDGGHTINLLGVTLASLVAADFAFGG